MRNGAATSLIDHLRRLLQVVEDACGGSGRGGVLRWSMALVMWVRGRRSRKEAADIVEGLKTLLEQLIVALEEVQARAAPEAPEMCYPAPQPPAGLPTSEEGLEAVRRAYSARLWYVTSVALPAGAESAQLRSSASSAVEILGRGGLRETELRCRRGAASGLRGATTQVRNAPHPPASGPIFASKNGNPSRAPPSPQSGEGNWRGGVSATISFRIVNGKPRLLICRGRCTIPRKLRSVRPWPVAA